MKVEQKKEFTPVTITLETQEELDVLCSLVGSVAGDSTTLVAMRVANHLWDALEELQSDNAPDYFNGSSIVAIM